MQTHATADTRPGWSKLLHSRHDADIFHIALPALASILLDPLMSLTDTGADSPASCF